MNEPRYLTPPQFAQQRGIAPEKVISWIRAGELEAINFSNGTRPRYRISPAAVEAFESRRAVHPKPKTKRRKRQKENDVMDII